MILLLVAASNYFGAVFSRLGSATLDRRDRCSRLDLPPTMMLLLILGIIFVLGWPLEWVPIVLIVVPDPAAARAEARHRPRLVLHAGRRVPADGVAVAAGGAVRLLPEGRRPATGNSSDIYAGMMQFMVLQIVGLLLLLAFPQIALWLPALLRE